MIIFSEYIQSLKIDATVSDPEKSDFSHSQLNPFELAATGH